MKNHVPPEGKRKRFAKFPASVTVRISDEQERQLYLTAERFQLSAGEILRDLIDNDLAKLNQRYKKRISRGQLRENVDVA